MYKYKKEPRDTRRHTFKSMVQKGKNYKWWIVSESCDLGTVIWLGTSNVRTYV